MTPVQDGAPVPQDEQSLHLQRTIEQLDESIARLALALGLSLDSHADLLRAIQGSPSHAHDAQGGAAHREESTRRELQGLLVLRYDLIRKYSESDGPEATRRMMRAVEQHLRALGFKQGADGIDLSELSADPEGTE